MPRIDDLHMNDLRRIEGAVVGAGRETRNLLHQFVVVALSEDIVVAVEVRRGNLGDEELGAVGVGAAIGHGEATGNVEGEVALFVAEGVAGTSGAVAEGIATLDHEVRNHAMKDSTVVKGTVVHGGAVGGILPVILAGGAADEVVNRDGRLIGKKS